MTLSAGRVIKTSLWVDVSDVAINVVLAVLSGSAVMLAKTLQGSADLMTSVFLWIGLRQSRRRADRDHKFGYGREMYFWTLMAAITMLTVTATVSLYHGWKHLIEPQTLRYTIPNLIVLLITLATNGYSFSLSWRRLKQATGDDSIIHALVDSSLVETKTTFVLDLMGTASGVFGFFSLGLFYLTGDSRFDGLGAIAIGGSVAVLALMLIFDVKDLIVGRGADGQIEDQIKRLAESVKGVGSVKKIRTMYVGVDQLLVILDIDFGLNHRPDKIDILIDRVKRKIHRAVPIARHIQIELET